MNLKKMILGGAAVIVVIASNLAFRVTNLRTKRVAGLTILHREVCKFCATLYIDLAAGSHIATCKSANGATLMQPGERFTWATNIQTCAPVVTRVTGFR
jgi:hypothetical protein